MLPSKFRIIWLSGFRGDFQKSTKQKQELHVAPMFVSGSGQNEQSLQRNFHRCFLPSFGSFGKAISEENFQRSTNQKQELSVVAMFVNGSGQNEQSQQRTFYRYFLLSLVSLAKRYQWRKKNHPIRYKNRLWRPCLLTDWDGMSNSHRGTSIDASYQVSVHLAKLFQRRRFLEIDQLETRIACGSHICKWIGTK